MNKIIFYIRLKTCKNLIGMFLFSKIFITFATYVSQCPGLSPAPFEGAGGKSGQHKALHF